MSVGYRIQPSPLVAEPGTLYVMADYGHPETPMTDFSWGPGGLEATPAEVPDGRIIVCHPDDEQRLRDAIAREQETPQWWLRLQAFEAVLRAAIQQP